MESLEQIKARAEAAVPGALDKTNSVSRNLEIAIGYTKLFSRSDDVVIRFYNEAGNVIESHERQMSGSAGKQ